MSVLWLSEEGLKKRFGRGSEEEDSEGLVAQGIPDDALLCGWHDIVNYSERRLLG